MPAPPGQAFWQGLLDCALGRDQWKQPRNAKEASAREERAKMVEALLRWLFVPGCPEPHLGLWWPKLETEAERWQQAERWAEGFWLLHHDAIRQFHETDWVFEPTRLQLGYRDGLSMQRFYAQQEHPLPDLANSLPPAVERALTELAPPGRAAVEEHIADLDRRLLGRIRLGWDRWRDGVEAGKPFVSGQRGPRFDNTLERHLHLGTMVRFLLDRGLSPRSRSQELSRKAGCGRSVYDTVAVAAEQVKHKSKRPEKKGQSLGTIDNAWNTFCFFERECWLSHPSRPWDEIFKTWRHRSRPK